MWVRDNEPDLYRQTYKTLNAKDYIVFKLTGKFCTEPSDASSNACVDLRTLSWSEKIIDISGIDPDKLPEIVPSTHVAGGVTREGGGGDGPYTGHARGHGRRRRRLRQCRRRFRAPGRLSAT